MLIAVMCQVPDIPPDEGAVPANAPAYSASYTLSLSAPHERGNEFLNFVIGDATSRGPNVEVALSSSSGFARWGPFEPSWGLTGGLAVRKLAHDTGTVSLVSLFPGFNVSLSTWGERLRAAVTATVTVPYTYVGWSPAVGDGVEGSKSWGTYWGAEVALSYRFAALWWLVGKVGYGSLSVPIDRELYLGVGDQFPIKELGASGPFAGLGLRLGV